MSLDFSIPSLSPLAPVDFSADTAGATEMERIKKVSKAMEAVFASQLMEEMGKGIKGIDGSKENGMYQDFIQQAMTQGFTSGKGLGLAQTIENYLSQHLHPQKGPIPTKTS